MKRFERWTCCAGLLLLVGLVAGCTATRSLVDKVTPGGPSLKKRVMVLPFLKLADFGDNQAVDLRQIFESHLQRSPAVLLVEGPAKVPWPKVSRSPDVEFHLPQEVLRLAQEKRVQMLITGAVPPLEHSTRNRWFWPFTRVQHRFEVSLVINVVDVPTQTLISSRLETETLSFKADEAPFIDPEAWVTEHMQGILTKMLKRQARAAAEKIEDAPWTGRVLAVDSQGVTLDAGSRVGIVPGHRFEAYAMGESLPAYGGRTIRLPGAPIGVLEAVSVSETKTIARPVEGGPYRAGLWVRFLP